MLCATRPAEWWETGDAGNRLALLLCAACPLRGCDDPEPHGVIVNGTAYGDAGEPLAVCHCGYPVQTVGRPGPCCTWCRVPPRQRQRRRNRKPATSRPPRRRPYVAPDESAVRRLLAGQRPAKVRQVDDAEAIRRLAAAGLGNRAIAQRLGKSTEAVARRRQRMAALSTVSTELSTGEAS